MNKVLYAFELLKTRLLWSWRFTALGARTTLGAKQLCNNPAIASVGGHTMVGDNWVFADLNPSEKSGIPKLKIGDWCRIQHSFQCNVYDNVEIGDYCLFAPRVFISDADHAPDPSVPGISLSPNFNSDPIKIGSGCWLGVNVTVLKGVTIGENSIVAAGSVVTKSFPPNSIIGGVPAKLLKRTSTQKEPQPEC